MFKKVFPKFGELDVVLPPGFVDESSIERAMPTFTKILPNGNVMRLWIDFKDKAKSKFPNDPRFRISVYSQAFIRLHDDIAVEKWNEVLIYLKGLEEYNTPYKPGNR